MAVGVIRAITALVACAWAATVFAQPAEPGVQAFLDAASGNRRRATEAQGEIAASWRAGYASMLVDLLDLVERTRDLNRQTFMQPGHFVSFLEQQTGQAFGEDIAKWREWEWAQPYEPHPSYGEFKGRLYALLDPRFVVFFRAAVQPTIRLDEIVWGGVSINGIPPLDHPKQVAAEEATYLEDDNVVFGLFVDGEPRAYPKRILAWHELALDRVGERELAIVYCTLCGTVIPFDARAGGKVLTFGTSGLLYRSNKLMFDQETASLWSSLTGEPVVGPLVQLKLRLTALPVVTTTWGEWRARHPDTRVLSLDTGFRRDYSEGAAYRAYFGTDELMFGVALRDGRLPNKAEVLVIRSTTPRGRRGRAAPAGAGVRDLDGAPGAVPDPACASRRHERRGRHVARRREPRLRQRRLPVRDDHGRRQAARCRWPAVARGRGLPERDVRSGH